MFDYEEKQMKTREGTIARKKKQKMDRATLNSVVLFF
jgi:hypothetical protein